jgi:L-amino acid N-acyltransferase YncA
MIVRAARAVDAAAICDILNPIIRHSTVTFTTEERSAESVAEDIRIRGEAFLVAADGDAVIGFATYGSFRGGPGYARTAEHSVHVASTARGRGAGRALMAQLEQVAAARGIHVMVAGVSGSNPGAVAFHRALGYEISGRMPEVGYKNGQYLELVLLQKRLTGPDGAPDTVAGTG